MIYYSPLFITMEKKGFSGYNLIYKQGISANTMQRLRQNKPITTKTLDMLCFILSCTVVDIIEYREDDSGPV